MNPATAVPRASTAIVVGIAIVTGAQDDRSEATAVAVAVAEEIATDRPVFQASGDAGRPVATSPRLKNPLPLPGGGDASCSLGSCVPLL